MRALQHSWILGVVGAACAMIAGSVYFVTGELGPAGQVFGVLGVAGLLGYGLLDRDRIAAGASTREALASASAGAVIALALVGSVLAVALVSGWDQTHDLTRDGRFTLSSRSRSLVESFQEPVQIYAFFQPNSPQGKSFDRLGKLYASASDNLTYHQIDPIRQPSKVRALLTDTGNEALDRIADSGAVLIVMGDRNRRIESGFDQTRITNALAKINSGEDHRICWSVGHGERGPDDDQTARGYGSLALRLEDRNAVIIEQRLFAAGVDPSCNMLVIAGPTQDFQPRSLQALARYLAGGGQVLLLLDSPLTEGADTPALDTELERYGLLLAPDVIIERDPNHFASLDTTDVLSLYTPRQFKPHPILDSLPVGLAVRWPRSVRAADETPTGIAVREMVASTQRSWADLNFDPTRPEATQPDPDELQGPVPLMAIAEILTPESLQIPGEDIEIEAGGRLLVVGDADLGANDLSSLWNNGDFFLSAVSYLVGDEDQIGADQADNEYLLVSATQLALLLLIGVLLVPGGAAITGGALVIRRRFL